MASSSLWLLLVVTTISAFLAAVQAEAKQDDNLVYVVTLKGEKPLTPDIDPNSERLHLHILEKVLKSSEEAKKALISSFFFMNGFSARLSKSAANKLAALPEVSSVSQRRWYHRRGPRFLPNVKLGEISPSPRWS